MTYPPAPGPARPLLSAVPFDHPDALLLTRALYREQLATYGFADDPAGTRRSHFEAPGLFLIARTADTDPAKGCGGVRLLDSATAEIKSMYVAETARGQGLGRHLLHRLERHAADSGAATVVLETGVRNHAALGLYRRCGYAPRPPYVPGRDQRVNRAMTKPLRRSH